MNFIITHLATCSTVTGGITYAIWEYWLGRNKWKSNSTVELVLNIIHDVTGKLLEKENQVGQGSTNTNTANQISPVMKG